MREGFRSLRRAFFCLFWLIPGSDTGNQKGFRHLRMATQGSALRTRGLSRKAGESFNNWCGALLAHAEIRENMIYNIILDTLTGQFSKALNRALDIIYHGIGRKTGL